jgi:hypothetical protein
VDKSDRAEYAKQWLAVGDSRLIAADHDLLKVYAAAKPEGVLVPFVVHVLPEDPLPFVSGW